MTSTSALRFTLLAAMAMPAAWSADTILAAAGSVWRYLDDGTDQGVAWRAAGFNDSGWKVGPAQLGYGDGDEATVVGYGPDANNKFVTTYFRRMFEAPDPFRFSRLTLKLLRDDGAVLYLNGTEVFRSNMPAGAVGFKTPASAAVSGADETTFETALINPAALRAGPNVIAVEIHQANGTSTDISFDLELTAGTGTASVIRGPYLQASTTSSVVVRWRTDTATSSRVLYGTTQGALNLFTDDADSTTEHIVKVSGLTPATKYYYAVGTMEQVLGGGDANHYFFTSPPVGAALPIRIWAVSDWQYGGATTQAVRDAYLAYTGTARTDVWLTMGDLSPAGTDAEYQAMVFNMFQEFLRTTALWPAIGNHDMNGSATPASNQPYFLAFTLPTGGEAGGMASGTQRYYSFDYGNVHFICLDSMTSNRTPAGPMLTWLKSDLASTRQRWIIAYWHHSPYSKGTHDSDTSPEMKLMRENVLPILEGGGADLVLGGHSHTYERSFLIDGHYGVSGTFSSAMKRNSGDSRTGAYLKPGVNPHEGTVYIVAGTASAPGALMTPTHPAMCASLGQTAGSLVLDVNGDQLDARFLSSAGAIQDRFTIRKGLRRAAAYKRLSK